MARKLNFNGLSNYMSATQRQQVGTATADYIVTRKRGYAAPGGLF